MPTCGYTSVLDGVSLQALQAQLVQMQAAYLTLMTGTKPEGASYTQADGSRSITYTRANIADLTQAIMLVQKQIAALTGCNCNRRPPIAPFF
ncbi:gpW family head-tail joining protein [Paraburkholderia mimosarum]|uniref:gpW family head-tail joining protein n=1 Tax=Paraburkholderia mimosarum TaxID=312026 RepID=UPI000686F8E3|nr:gpW family head-tail joining protein [Paraburkholderia mimosarum]